MDKGTMFLLGIVCVTALVTWILGRQHSHGLEAEEQRRLVRELERERVRLAALAEDRAARERHAGQSGGREELVREPRVRR